jgi:hypothetical protein
MREFLGMEHFTPMICAGPRRRLLDALALHGPTSRRCSIIFRAT